MTARHDSVVPRRAMVLAAGSARACGRSPTRCQSRWSRSPASRCIDHVLDRLADAGVERAVVNVHHFADQIEQHLAHAQRSRRS